VSSANINEYFLRKLSKVNISFESEEFGILTKKGEELTGLGIDSDKKILSYKLVKAAGRSLGLEVPQSVYHKAIDQKISNKNDAYLILLENRIKERGIKKAAYPNPFGQNYDVKEEVDINKWLKTVHLIYDSVQKEQMTKQNALEYYSNFLDIEREEDTRFKKWFKYYSEGEHLKYSSSEEQDMKKSAIYMSNLGQGNSNYTHSRGGFNMPGDSFDGATFDETADRSRKDADESSEFSSWKGKLHGALRRIDKLLRSKHMDGEKYKMLAEHLLNLSHQVHILRLASTISDVTHKTANTFKKHGQKDAAEMLVKIAQQVPEEAPIQEEGPPAGASLPEEAPMQEEGPPAGASLPEEAPMQEEGPPAEAVPDPNDPKSAIPSGDDVDPVELKDITPIPGARPGEYEELSGSISLDDAARKLDEVAGMLADRRIIRQLAEFDIMLDKIGIASMFPELAESQSKLIDSFSYALTRVTKMMGQLANAKSIADTRTDLPGRPEPEEEAPEAEAPQEEAFQESEI
jgi:hypothetical protein